MKKIESGQQGAVPDRLFELWLCVPVNKYGHAGKNSPTISQEPSGPLSDFVGKKDDCHVDMLSLQKTHWQVPLRFGRDVRNPIFGVSDQVPHNWPVQLKNMTSSLKFRI